MKALVRFSLKQVVFFNLVFAVLMAVGAWALLALPVERYPEVNFGKVVITTIYPGASPQDMEALVTDKIEDALEDLEDVEFIRSKSYAQRSSIMVKFVDDSDYEALYDELRFKVLNIADELPDGADPPTFNMLQVSDWLPVVSVNIAGPRSNRSLTLMAEQMKIPLRRIPGVKEVKLQGEYEREFHVLLDPARMTALGVTFDQAAEALQSANTSIPAGDFTNGSGEFLVRVDERFRTRAEVMAVVVRSDADGSFVTVGDVADDARLSHRRPSVISSVDGRDCVTLQVLKSPQGNALDIAEQVRAVVDRFAPLLEREDVAIVLTQDSTSYIKESMRTLGSNMLLGMVLVAAIIWYFMGLRNAGLTTIGIPFSFLVTMVFMHLTGNSLNEVTLFSFVLMSGIIVDDAIVVVENIYRHVQKGKPMREAVIDGTAQVMLPVVAATSTTVAAFLPMLMMSGSTGEFFALIPKAVAFSIAASLIECLFILPIHYMHWGPRPDAQAREDDGGDAPREADNLLMRWLRRGVEPLIRLTLRFRVLSLVTVLTAFVLAMAVFVLSFTGKAQLIRIKFFPDDYKLYYAILEGPSTATIEQTSRRLKDMSAFIAADGPHVARSAAGFAGYYLNEDYEPVFGGNLGHVLVTLPDKDMQDFPDNPDNDPVRHLEVMRARLAERFAGQGWDLKVRAEKDGPPAGKDVNVRVLGPNHASVHALARAVMDFLDRDPAMAGNLEQLDDDLGRPSRVYRMAVREDRAAEFGIGAGRAAGLAAAVLDGRYIGKFRLSDEEVDLKLKVDPAALHSPGDALRIPVAEHYSGPVRLGDVVTPTAYTEPDMLNRYQGQRAVTVTANIAPGASVTGPAVVRLVSGFYEAHKAEYPGAAIAFGGEHEDTRRSYTSLGYAFGVAVLVMYLILATQFGSYLQPLIILSAVVFSLIGVIVGKVVTQSLFTVNSFIAVVGVTGVVVNDSLVLIDFINRKYRAGLPRREAIAEGIRIRLRPIVLTTLTTTLGLLPMALGIPSYSLVWGTMASTFVTGLCTATFLTLFIVPVEWDLLEGLAARIARLRGKDVDPDATHAAEDGHATEDAE